MSLCRYNFDIYRPIEGQKIIVFVDIFLKVKCMQRSGTEATRTQLQPSKPKRELTNITNSQNTKGTYGQPSEQIFPKTLDEKSNLQIPSNLLQRFGTAAVCIVLLIFISGLYDFTLHLQIRKYDGLTYCGRIAKIITTAF